MRLALVALVVSLLTPAAPPLTVSAAISLTNALDTLGPMYTRSGGAEVRFNYGASNTLARQIVKGAPVDVFISADEAQMKVVEDAGAVAAGTRMRLLGNRLVLLTLKSGVQGGILALRRPDFRRIVIGDPAAVPAGVYAKEWLTAEGLWDELQPKLVPVANVRAALAAVENGSADAAFVYETDAHTIADKTRIYLPAVWVPDRIVYPAAIIKYSRNQAESARFLKFLCGADAAAVFEKMHFIPLGCT
jgi:molybdate transport system substrate-binding protein